VLALNLNTGLKQQFMPNVAYGQHMYIIYISHHSSSSSYVFSENLQKYSITNRKACPDYIITRKENVFFYFKSTLLPIKQRRFGSKFF